MEPPAHSASIFDQPPRNDAYPSEGSYPRDRDSGTGGQSFDDMGGGEPDPVEPMAFPFRDDLPEAVSVTICSYALDGTPTALGPGLRIDCTISDIVRAYPAAMPQPGEKERVFVAIPVNAAGRRLNAQQQRFTISSDHQAVLDLRRGPLEKSTSPSGGLESIVTTLLGELVADRKTARDEARAAREELARERAELARERAQLGQVMTADLSAGYTGLLNQANSSATNNTQIVKEALTDVAAVERQRSEAHMARIEKLADDERRRGEQRLAEIKADAEARVLIIKAEADARIAQIHADAEERRRTDAEMRRDRQEGADKLETERLRLANELELARIRNEERMVNALAADRERDRQILEVERKALDRPAQSLRGLLSSGMELLALVGIKPETLKTAVGGFLSGGGGGGESTVVTVVKEVGKVLRTGMKNLGSLPAEDPREADGVDPEDLDDDEDEDLDDEDSVDEPRPRQRRRRVRREAEAIDQEFEPGAPEARRPEPAQTAPPRTAAEPPKPAPPDPVDVALSKLDPGLLTRARARMNEVVDALDGREQHEWGAFLGPFFLEHQADLEPYLITIKVPRALREAGATDELVRDVVAVGQTTGLLRRELL